jgi:hypothetical protein
VIFSNYHWRYCGLDCRLANSERTHARELPMRNRIFHQARIGGITFEGIISADGPHIIASTGGGVALGVSALRYFQPEAVGSGRHQPAGWWVVKYSHEERIFLPDFDRAAIHELSDEFGLVLLVDDQTDPTDHIRQHYFFTSPAWDGLRQWVIRHPRIARARAGGECYLPDWYRRAKIEAAALPPDFASSRIAGPMG